jgi:hypothetical protein
MIKAKPIRTWLVAFTALFSWICSATLKFPAHKKIHICHSRIEGILDIRASILDTGISNYIMLLRTILLNIY